MVQKVQDLTSLVDKGGRLESFLPIRDLSGDVL